MALFSCKNSSDWVRYLLLLAFSWKTNGFDFILFMWKLQNYKIEEEIVSSGGRNQVAGS